MQSLAHYSLLGSLLAGAAGAVVIAAVTLKYGFSRSAALDSEDGSEASVRRQRTVRLADTVAVLCFAVSAGLGVVGVMQHTRGDAPAVVVRDDARIADRLEALEARASATITPEWRGFEERLARLESRLGAVEDRAAVAERRAIASEQLVREQRARDQREGRTRAASATTAPPRAAAPSSPRSLAPPKPASPSSSASQSVASASPATSSATSSSTSAPSAAWPSGTLETAPPPAPLASEVTPKPAPSTTTAAALPREVARPRPEMPPANLSLGQKVRRDWASVKDAARRGGDEWREGWDRVKGMFGY